jgi:hypothetical protein
MHTAPLGPRLGLGPGLGLELALIEQPQPQEAARLLLSAFRMLSKMCRGENVPIEVHVEAQVQV